MSYGARRPVRRGPVVLALSVVMSTPFSAWSRDDGQSGVRAAVSDVSPAGAASPTPPFFDVNKYQAEPNSPGAIRLPGTNVAIYLGGFAQLDVIYDFNAIGSPDQFVVSSIPGGGETGHKGSELTARQSRVFVETDAPWDVASLMAYVEVDFFDPQNQANLHIRHAFGAIGRPGGVRLLGGQTWTSFMDATVFPSQLDYAGPVGIVNVQQPQARLVVPLDNEEKLNGRPHGIEWVFAIEAPNPQITVPVGIAATAFSDWPDVVTTFRWDHSHGHVLASGLFRQIGILPTVSGRADTLGYGCNLTGSLSGLEGNDQFLWSVGGGKGIARYFAGSNGLNLDGVLRPDGRLVTPRVMGVMGSYQHYFWEDRVSLTAIYSLLHLFDLDPASDATLKRSQYLGAVFQYFPNKRFMTGLEYLFGQRENRNDQVGDDNRLQVSTQVKF